MAIHKIFHAGVNKIYRTVTKNFHENRRNEPAGAPDVKMMKHVRNPDDTQEKEDVKITHDTTFCVLIRRT